MRLSQEGSPDAKKNATKIFEQASVQVRRQVKQALKRATARCEAYQSKLTECQNWSAVQHKAFLLQSNLYKLKKGMPLFSASDWDQEGKEIVILLDPLLEPSQQVAQLFRKSRKLRLGEPHLIKQLALAKADFKSYSEQWEQFSRITSMEELQQFSAQYEYSLEKKPAAAKKIGIVPRLPYDCYLSSSQTEIWVGKSAKNNDRLTFEYAKGLDFWLHARDYPGSHIVVRVLKQQVPDQETLNDACELALRFSKCRSDAEVTMSQVKFIKKIKGTPGKVMLSKQRSLYWKLEPARWERIKHSKVTK